MQFISVKQALDGGYPEQDAVVNLEQVAAIRKHCVRPDITVVDFAGGGEDNYMLIAEPYDDFMHRVYALVRDSR